MKSFLQILTSLLLLLAVSVQASQQGVVVRLAPVHAKANAGSALVGQLSPGTRVSIFSRQGGWKEVYSEPQQLVGWVRSFQVREGQVVQQTSQAKTESDSRGFLSGLASFSRKASRFFRGSGSSTSSGTATIGVRGLSEEELKSAKPDLEQFAKMKQFASDGTRVAKFKLDGQLSEQQVAHIKKKKKKKKKNDTSGSNR